MTVPAGARFWCHVCLHKVRDHLAVRGLGNAQVAVEEKVAQAARHKFGITRFDMRELGGCAVQHGMLLLEQKWIGAVQQLAGTVPAEKRNDCAFFRCTGTGLG